MRNQQVQPVQKRKFPKIQHELLDRLSDAADSLDEAKSLDVANKRHGFH